MDVDNKGTLRPPFVIVWLQK